MNDDTKARGNDAKLKRDIGVFAAGFLVLNGMIGSGIYGLPGTLADQAGIFSPWLFIIIGALFLTVVWTFAALASYFNYTGGPVVYASRAFGPLIGFQTGWLLYVGRVSAFAANSNVLFDYATYLWDGASDFVVRSVLLLVVIGGLTVINILGIKKAVQAINILTFLKIVPLLVLVLIGLQYLSPAGFLPSELPKFDDTGALALLVLYAFVGFEGAVVTAGETKNPKKTLPRALITTVLLITLLYFIIQLVYVSVAPIGSGNAPLVELGTTLIGPIGGVIIIITAIFSVTGNVTSIIIAAPRMTYAMAEDNSLPLWFSKVHEKYNTPANSIIFLGVFAFLLAITGTFIYLAIASTLSRMIAYSICILSLPFIRKKADEETLKQATVLPGGYIIPAVGFIVCVFAASQSTANSWMYMAGFIGLGSILYFLNYKFQKRS
ncbi:MAG: APC family permease [Proteobacteria bacterium]|jgi:basic amino acid/polyamine antiporter, APA family|nr:APC family permease [Pseudomonadota bacterium]